MVHAAEHLFSSLQNAGEGSKFSSMALRRNFNPEVVVGAEGRHNVGREVFHQCNACASGGGRVQACIFNT
jgi:hypothetical protein